MKKILFLILIPVIVFGQVNLIETQYGDGIEFYIYATSVDSGSYNQELNLKDFDADLVNYPLSFNLKIDTLLNDTDTEIIGVYIQGYQIDKWINVDTLSLADTLNASHSLASASFYASGVLDLNAATIGTFPRYRLNVAAIHRKTDLFSFYVKLYASKRD